ncbi:DNA-binding transcriptional MerR regulator [Saccharothrix tamanrassetensis]|uniref:DNA-binding transcriptional MerR regulator n=1 Tax=Saccharothrix tamanrassetensis TaxID=1051531 RepID=A0A841CDF9_9PSEU|nr:MerR family transcriptional regulator [Saccharothrix tamanrassetensis]MBB5953796.1 DNA-binding transcriptional MerR regulator [Saccharothrix tamanrassetensis]
MDDELWTIEQLPERVAALLAENYDGQRSGRVRELPNGRAIRWYTTIGLVDRPTAHKGRTALYGRRQLLQIVAVKKLQAAGHSLAEIQSLTLGASDSKLAGLAGVDGPPARAGGGFWKERPAAAPIAPPRPAGTVEVVPSFRLNDSVTVVLGSAGRLPDAEELAEIEAAAAPLLDLLARLGLDPTTGEDDQ